MLTRSPFPSMLVFQKTSCSCISSSNSVIMTRSSAYSFSQRHPVWNSWENSSRTMMNSIGLRQEPWWTPTFTLNYSSEVTTNTHSASRIFIHALYDQHLPLLNAKLAKGPLTVDTQSNTFSRSTTAMHSVLLMAWDFSCNWRTMNMGLWCQAWSQTACYRCAFVVVGSSQPPSLEPLWPG